MCTGRTRPQTTPVHGAEYKPIWRDVERPTQPLRSDSSRVVTEGPSNTRMYSAAVRAFRVIIGLAVFVIHAQAGINLMDSRLRGNDGHTIREPR